MKPGKIQGAWLIGAGLQPRHVRAAESDPGAQGQRTRPVSVARPEAAVLERCRPNRQCKKSGTVQTNIC
jgi:hypothetical protein